MRKIAIVGGGTSGIFLSLLLRDFEGEVHLFEQNRKIGRKLERTGGGRMNVSNKVFSAREFSSIQPNLLKKLFKNPWIGKRMTIFEELGIAYNWEKNRAILRNQSATKEIERLYEEMKRQENLEIHLEERVEGVEVKSERYMVDTELEKGIEFDGVVFCGGGMFRIGDHADENEIYRLPKGLGHTVTGLSPSLSPILIGNNPLGEFSGIAFKMRLSDLKGNKMEGDTLITHEGLSGPLPLDFSSVLEGDTIFVNFIPDVNEEAFTAKFNDLRQGKNGVKGFLNQFFPKRLCEWFLMESGIGSGVLIADVNKETFKSLKNNLFRLRLDNARILDYQFCWTTKGGVDLKEVNVATLESKLHKNIYFAGEILDVNGLCGGYNISFAAISAKIVSEALVK